MTFPQFLSVLRARWRSALVVWLTVVGVVAVLSLVLPRQFTASGAVLVDIRTPDPVAGSAMPAANVTTSSVMATQMDVMQSERVIMRALTALKLADNPQLREKWMSATNGAGSFEAWIVETMQKKLEVRPSRDSSVLSIAYTSPDPQFSANVVNALVRSYIDTTLDLKVDPAQKYGMFFENRAKELRASLEQVQGRLSTFQQSKGLLATDERVDIENTRLNELSSQLVALQAVTSESGSRSRQSGDTLQEVLANPLVQNLNLEVSRQEARLRELNERLGPNHPQVKEQSATLQQSRRQLAAAKSSVTASVGVNNKVNQQRLKELNTAVAEQRAKVLTLKGQRDQAAVLLRDVESAQRSYDAMLMKAEQAKSEGQSTGTNLTIIKHASPPALPSSPQVFMNLSVAMVLGGLLALLVALARERMDPRLRSEQDILEGLKQSLLVVLPMSTKRTAEGRSRLQLTKTRVVTGLPRPAH
jgi:succinoglycan biosynthesis transport protein ExoP